MADQILTIVFSIIITIIITFLVQNFVFPLLPASVRDFTKYHKKKFLKIVKQQEIDIELVIKTKNYDGDKSLDEVTELLKKTIQKQFEVSFTTSSLITKIPIGNDKVEINIIPDFIVEDDLMKFELLECRFTTKCKFHKLNETILSFREAQHKMANILNEIGLPRFDERLSLICKLKSLHEITDILENAHFESLHAELNDGKKFEISRDKITIYDQEISPDTISLAKKMIVMYD